MEKLASNSIEKASVAEHAAGEAFSKISAATEAAAQAYRVFADSWATEQDRECFVALTRALHMCSDLLVAAEVGTECAEEKASTTAYTSQKCKSVILAGTRKRAYESQEKKNLKMALTSAITQMQLVSRSFLSDGKVLRFAEELEMGSLKCQEVLNEVSTPLEKEVDDELWHNIWDEESRLKKL